MKRLATLVCAVAVVGTALQVVPAHAIALPTDAPARRVEPVVMTGEDLPAWSRLAADGVAADHVSSQSGEPNAHNGEYIIPEDARAGVKPGDIAAFRWEGGRFVEIPAQVDERFPYFLVNPKSDFGIYSGTDKELSYEWDVESWRQTAGTCFAEYPNPGDTATQDPVTTFDDDDELVFMADDAAGQAPADALGPYASYGERHEVRLADPRDPAAERYVYLFLRPGGSAFTASSGYVDYERDANANEWIDKNSFHSDDPEKLGTSNGGYGPNHHGTVCNPDGTVRNSDDRFKRDGLTVSTDTYRWRASGRWMIRGMQVTKPGTIRQYGPDLIDRWKGRAFQQSPDSAVSLVGFEDEQVNWEGNSQLLGELWGPVRAIRETWGADSGTNVTKTETFYRDAVTYRYRVRVHPIPPDGLYTSWDYNHDVAARYFNETKTDGVAIDGVNDDVGSVDNVGPAPAFFDAPDPTFTKPLAFLNWEQVSGRANYGSLVYLFEMKNVQALENPLVTPYYRDDACLDDGTGDNPSPRPNPGEAYKHESFSEEERNRPCFTEAPAGYTGPYKQGAFGSHGIHYLITGDTDNSFSPANTTEIDGQQWQFAVPTGSPTNVGDKYANVVKTPLVPAAAPQENPTSTDQSPSQTEITGATSGRVGETVTLSARVTSDGAPVSGEMVLFFLRGQRVGGAVTDNEGVARIDKTLSGPAGDTELTASFGGSERHEGSSATVPFQITE